MIRDYNELINMSAVGLAAFALDCAKMGVLYVDLVEALAYCLDLEAKGAELCMRELQEQLEDAELRADMWQEECRALQRQLDVVR